MDEIKEVDDETQKQYSTSQYSDKFKKANEDRQIESKEEGKVKNLSLLYLENLYYENAFSQPDSESAFMHNPSTNPVENYTKSIPKTSSGYRPRKTNPGNLGHEELIKEINELKKSNMRDVDEIKRLKTEQQKIENLYKKYKEIQNDVFTAERLIAKNDVKVNNHDFPIINKQNLVPEIDKVKKMLVNKIKAIQTSKGRGVFVPKRGISASKINVKSKKNANLVCRSCKAKAEQYLQNPGENYSGMALDESVNKSIVRIQIKKLKELKTTLEADLKKKETELEKLKKTNSTDQEKVTEKELKKSLNILRGLKKKLVKLKEENGNVTVDSEIDPIIKSIDKELNKTRKWRPKLPDTAIKQEEEKVEPSLGIDPNTETQEQADLAEDGDHEPVNLQTQNEYDTKNEEKELKNNLEELEKELALSDEEFERRLIDRLKKEIKTNSVKLEKKLKQEFITKQKEIYNKNDEEIARLKKENDELSSYIARIRILLSS